MFELKICCCSECNDGCGHNSIVNGDAETVCPKCGNENVSFIVKKGNLESLNNVVKNMNVVDEAPDLLNKSKIERTKERILCYLKDTAISVPVKISLSIERENLGDGMCFRFLKSIKFDDCDVSSDISENILNIINDELNIDDICISKEIRLK